MAAQLVHLCQHVEQEGLHIEVESLVVEEEFGKEAEVLAVDLVVTSVHVHSGGQGEGGGVGG